MSEPTQTISFRLPSALIKQLTERATAQSLSVGECDSQMVLNILSDSANEQTREDLAELRAGLERLREDLATATAALLVNAGKATQTDAEAWVRQSLFHQR